MAVAQASAGAASSSNDRRKRWLKLGAALLLFLGVLVIAITLGIEHGQKRVRKPPDWAWAYMCIHSVSCLPSTTAIIDTQPTICLF
jgi:hypothetical protein